MTYVRALIQELLSSPINPIMSRTVERIITKLVKIVRNKTLRAAFRPCVLKKTRRQIQSRRYTEDSYETKMKTMQTFFAFLCIYIFFINIKHLMTQLYKNSVLCHNNLK